VSKNAKSLLANGRLISIKKKYNELVCRKLEQQLLNYLPKSSVVNNLFRKAYLNERIFRNLINSLDFSSLFEKTLQLVVSLIEYIQTLVNSTQSDQQSHKNNVSCRREIQQKKVDQQLKPKLEFKLDLERKKDLGNKWKMNSRNGSSETKPGKFSLLL